MFEPFVPDKEAYPNDEDENAYEEGCGVLWLDDPVIPSGGGQAKSNEPPPSYRFTPREARVGFGGQSGHFTKSSHSIGRAKILFRHAIQRHSLRQKALIAAAAWAQADYEEMGQGCVRLAVQNNSLGSRGASYLASLVRHTETLEELALGKNPLGDTGAALLGRALKQSWKLKTLALQDCGIGAKGVRHLSGGLAHNRSLQRLWLFGNAAADEGTAHLAGALRTSKLESLGLEKNGVSVRGCEALGVALAHELCPLYWLRLQHNPLGDDGVCAIARSLQTNKSLTRLQMRDVGVDVRGCSALADAVRRHEALRGLSLEDNGLDAASTEPLLHAMQASKAMTNLSLDLEHGGSYERVRTKDEMASRLALQFIQIAARKKLASAASKMGPAYQSVT